MGIESEEDIVFKRLSREVAEWFKNRGKRSSSPPSRDTKINDPVSVPLQPQRLGSRTVTKKLNALRVERLSRRRL